MNSDTDDRARDFSVLYGSDIHLLFRGKAAGSMQKMLREARIYKYLSLFKRELSSRVDPSLCSLPLLYSKKFPFPCGANG